jgi:hypothetical protein
VNFLNDSKQTHESPQIVSPLVMPVSFAIPLFLLLIL